METVFETLRRAAPASKLRAFVSATGSAGTLAAGDYLKDRYGSKIVAVEALECPTLLYNGFGDHNIQGIGDKHVPFIHNVMNTDVVTAISDAATDSVNLLLNLPEGRHYLTSRRGVAAALLEQATSFGLSSLCNLLAAVKTAKHYGWGPEDVIVSVATDGAEMYESERRKALDVRFAGRFDEIAAAEVFGQHLLGCATDHLLELGETDRRRIFNLRVLHLGRTTARADRCVPGTARSEVLARPARHRPALGRDDQRVQPANRRCGGMTKDLPRLACAACGWTPGPPEVDPYPFRCPHAGIDDGDRVMSIPGRRRLSLPRGRASSHAGSPDHFHSLSHRLLFLAHRLCSRPVRRRVQSTRSSSRWMRRSHGPRVPASASRRSAAPAD